MTRPLCELCGLEHHTLTQSLDALEDGMLVHGLSEAEAMRWLGRARAAHACLAAAYSRTSTSEPKARNSGAERTKRWRDKKRLGGVTDTVTGDASREMSRVTSLVSPHTPLPGVSVSESSPAETNNTTHSESEKPDLRPASPRDVTAPVTGDASPLAGHTVPPGLPFALAYRDRYEKALNTVWMSFAASDRDCQDIERWVHAQARIEQSDVKAVRETLLARFWVNAWAIEQKWPLRALAKNPARFYAQGGPTERPRTAAEQKQLDEIKAWRREYGSAAE